jgi:hypothetical protein
MPGDVAGVILNGISDDDAAENRLKADLPRLMRRAAMMNRAIFWAVIASIALTVLVIVAFVTAFFQLQHERGVAIFFMISLGAFTISLVDFAHEVRIALKRVRSSRLTQTGAFQGRSASTSNTTVPLSGSLPELEACLQTDVTWRAADALLRGATCPDCRREF